MIELFTKIFSLETTSYWVLLIWMFGIGAILSKMPKKTELVCGRYQTRWHWSAALLLVFPLVMWTAYRPYIGDTLAYMRHFDEVPSYFRGIPAYLAETKKDRGFSLLIAVLKCLGVPNYRTFFLILAAFQVWCMVYTFRKYSHNYWISIFLFVMSTDYVSWMFNGIRQFTAACMLFAAFPLLVEHKYVRFGLVVLLASTIHGSALLMLPFACIMTGGPLNRKTAIMMCCVLLIIPFIDAWTPVLEKLLSDTQYSDVMTNEIWAADDGTNLIRVLVYSVPALVALLGYRYIQGCTDPMTSMCINASVITMAVYLISAVTSGIYIGRIPIYTTLHGYIVLPWLIDQIFEKMSAALIKLLMISFYVLFFIYQMKQWGLL